MHTQNMLVRGYEHGQEGRLSSVNLPFNREEKKRKHVMISSFTSWEGSGKKFRYSVHWGEGGIKS